MKWVGEDGNERPAVDIERAYEIANSVLHCANSSDSIGTALVGFALAAGSAIATATEAGEGGAHAITSELLTVMRKGLGY